MKANEPRDRVQPSQTHRSTSHCYRWFQTLWLDQYYHELRSLASALRLWPTDVRLQKTSRPAGPVLRHRWKEKWRRSAAARRLWACAAFPAKWPRTSRHHWRQNFGRPSRNERPLKLRDRCPCLSDGRARSERHLAARPDWIWKELTVGFAA